MRRGNWPEIRERRADLLALADYFRSVRNGGVADVEFCVTVVEKNASLLRSVCNAGAHFLDPEGEVEDQGRAGS
jgi:hypothetical protein